MLSIFSSYHASSLRVMVFDSNVFVDDRPDLSLQITQLRLLFVRSLLFQYPLDVCANVRSASLGNSVEGLLLVCQWSSAFSDLSLGQFIRFPRLRQNVKCVHPFVAQLSNIFIKVVWNTEV